MDPKIDSMFFSNFKNIQTQCKKQNIELYSLDDFKLYKREIFKTFKYLMNGKLQDDNLYESYNLFIRDIIEHLKFKNKVKQIQGEYKSLNDDAEFDEDKNVKNALKYRDISNNANELLYNDVQNKNVVMDNFIKRKQNGISMTHVFPKQKIYPKKRIIKKNDTKDNDTNTNTHKNESKKERKTMKIDL